MSTVAETATLAWGYTMADIERLANRAVGRHGLSHRMDYSDRHDVAWHAIVEELYTTPELPAPYRLITAGLRALDREISDYRHHHGIITDGFAPKYERYWRPVTHPQTDGFTDRLIEVLALPAALSVLSPEQYEAIVTLAAFDNAMQDAADAVGMKYHGFYYRVQAARAKIKEVWFEEETPVGSKPTAPHSDAGTCRSGHPRAEHGRQLPSGIWECRTCKNAAARRRRARAA